MTEESGLFQRMRMESIRRAALETQAVAQNGTRNKQAIAFSTMGKQNPWEMLKQSSSSEPDNHEYSETAQEIKIRKAAEKRARRSGKGMVQ